MLSLTTKNKFLQTGFWGDILFDGIKFKWHRYMGEWCSSFIWSFVRQVSSFNWNIFYLTVAVVVRKINQRARFVSFEIFNTVKSETVIQKIEKHFFWIEENNRKNWNIQSKARFLVIDTVMHEKIKRFDDDDHLNAFNLMIHWT